MRNLKSRSLLWSSRVLPYGLVMIGLLAASPSFAGILYWDANGTNTGSGNVGGTWGSANWSTDSAGAFTTSGWTSASDAYFSAGSDGTGPFNVFVNQGVTVDNLTVGLGSVTLTNSGGSIALGAASTWGAASGASLTVNPALANSGYTLTINSTGTTTLAGTMTGGGGLLSLGSGTLTISGSNTYTGTTTLSSGQLNVNRAWALGTGALVIAGGTLGNTSAAALTLATTNTQYWNADFAFAGTKDLGLGAGAVTMNASRAITISTGTLTVGGAISGPGFTLTKNGIGTLTLNGTVATTTGGIIANAGTLNLSANNTYSGTTTINNSAAVVVSNATGLGSSLAYVASGGTLQLNAGGNITYSNTISGPGLLRAYLTAGSAANLYMPNVSTTFTGTIQLANAGSAQGNKWNAQGINAPSAVVVVDNNSQLFPNTTADTFSKVYITGTGNTEARGAIRLNGTLNADVILLGNATIGSEGGTLNGNISSGAAGTQVLTIGAPNSPASWTYSGVIGGGTGTLGLTSTMGANTLTLTGNNTYAGTTTINKGTLQIGNSTATGSLGTGPVSISSGAILKFARSDAAYSVSATIGGAGGLVQAGPGTVTLAASNTYTGTTTVSAGTLTITGSLASTPIVVNGGTLQLNNAGAVFASTLSMSSGSITQNIANAISGTSALNMNGGTLALSQANNYSGITNFNGGTLLIGNDNALGNTSQVSMNSAGTLQASTTVSVASNVQFNFATNWTVSGSYPLTINGPLKNYSGNRVLTSSITTPAALTLAGAVYLSESDTTGRYLTIAGTGNTTISGVISNANTTGTGGPGGLVYNGSGTLLLTGSNSFTGITTVSGGGVLQYNSANAMGVGGALMATTGAAAFNFTGANAALANHAVNASTGTLALTAASAAEDMNFSNLVDGDGNAGLNTPAFLGAVGSVNYTGTYTPQTAGIYKLGGGGGTLTYGQNITGASSLWIGGAAGGSVLLTGNNTYTGTTTIAASTLIVGSATAIPTGTLAMTGGVLDLNGNNLTFFNMPTSSGGTITDSGATGGTDTLTINYLGANIATTLIQDGSTNKVKVVVNFNNNSTVGPTNLNNTFSGGLVLAGTSGSTRLTPVSNTSTIKGPYGTGPIYIGQNAGDKDQIFYGGNNVTITNPIVFNSAAGTDKIGAFRIDYTGEVLSGNLTAGNAAVNFHSEGTGGVLLTGTITSTGSNGLTLLASTTMLTVTLSNAIANANTYVGDTLVTDGKETLALGAADQIPNGVGKGNLVNNGIFNMAGFSETVNGLVGNGTIDGTTGSPTLTFGDGNATQTFTGLIKNTAGSLALVKIGAGTQTLGGTNTAAGGLWIKAGNVIAQTRTTALGGATAGLGAVTLGDTSNSNAAGLFGGSATTFANPITLATNASAGTLTVGSVGNNAVVFSGGIGGTNDVTLFNGGTAQLTFSTAAINNAGVVTNAGTGTGTTVISGGIGSSVTGVIQNSATSMLVLSSTNSYTATTTISAGTLEFTQPAALYNTLTGSWTAANLPVASGATLAVNYGGSNEFSSDQIQTLLTNLTVGINNNGLQAGANFAIDTSNAAGSVTYSGTIVNSTGTGAGAVGFTKFGPNTLVLSASNGYSGPTTIAAGTLQISSSYNIGSGAAGNTITLSGGTLESTANTYDLGANRIVTLAAAGSILSDAGTLTVSGTVNNGAYAFTLGGTGNGVVSGLINGGAGGLTKIGSGAWTLSKANTYTGGTTINGGLLRLTAVGASGTYTISSTSTLDFATGSGLSTGANMTFNGNGTLKLEVNGMNFGASKDDYVTMTGGLVWITNNATITGSSNNRGHWNTNQAALQVDSGSTINFVEAGNNAGGTAQFDYLSGGGNISIGYYNAEILKIGVAGGSGTFDGVLADGSGKHFAAFQKAGAGTQRMTNAASSYDAVTVLNQGVLEVTSVSNYGANSALGNRPLASETSSVTDGYNSGIGLHFTGGTLRFAGNSGAAQSTNRQIRLGSNTTNAIDASGTTTNDTVSFTFSGTNTNFWDNAGTRSLTLTGTNTGNNVFAINIQNYGASATTLVKSGVGTWDITNSRNSDDTTTAQGTYGGYSATQLAGGTLGFAKDALGGGVVDFTANSTLRWDTGNNQDITTGTGGGVARSVKIEDGVTATLNTNGNDVALSNPFAFGTNRTAAVTKTGLGTLTLAGLSSTTAGNYTGATTIDRGTLTFTNTNPSFTGGLTFGGAVRSTNPGTLDLNAVSATFAGAALVQTNTTSANTIIVGNGQTLTLGGGLTMGTNNPGSPSNIQSTAALTFSGTGNLAITGNVQIGVGQSSFDSNNSNTSTAILDLRSLSSFTSNGANFYVGQGPQSGGTVYLSMNNTIRATTLEVGESNLHNPAGDNFLYLGTGTNVINADTINLALSKANGTLSFLSTAAGPGTVTIANKAGTGLAAIDIGDNNSANTGMSATGTLDLRGHTATVNASTVTVGKSNISTYPGSPTGYLYFDTGTFEAMAMAVATKTANGTGAANGSVYLSGGDFIVHGTTTLGAQSGKGSANALLSITGGTFTSYGNIIRDAGTVTSTLILDGGTLDMSGKAIGDAAHPLDTVTLASGTLRNVSQINGGTTGVTKTGSGTLVYSGTMTYSGATNVSNGTLRVNTALPNSAVTVNNTATLAGNGTFGGLVTVAPTAFVSPGNSPGTHTYGAGWTMNGAAIWELGAYKDILTGVAGTDFDQFVVTGGTMALGGTSKLSISFYDGLGDPDHPSDTSGFWNAAHTWKVVDVQSPGTNSDSTYFGSVLSGSYTKGTFTTRLGAGDDVGDIFLDYALNDNSVFNPTPTTTSIKVLKGAVSENHNVTLTNGGTTQGNYGTTPAGVTIVSGASDTAVPAGESRTMVVQVPAQSVSGLGAFAGSVAINASSGSTTTAYVNADVYDPIVISSSGAAVTNVASGNLQADAKVITAGASSNSDFTVTGLAQDDLIHPGSTVGGLLFNSVNKLNGTHKTRVTAGIGYDSNQAIEGAPSGVFTNIDTVVSQPLSSNLVDATKLHVAQTANVMAGQEYTNFSSSVVAVPVQIDPVTGQQTLGSTATLLGGTASAATTLSMTWSARTAAEVGTGPISKLLSDVVTVSGTGSDRFVLQVSYDDSQLTATGEYSWAAAGRIQLAVRNGLAWSEAESASGFQGIRAWTGDVTLGHWGVDTLTNQVWAVLDYSGTFAVVPEPGTLALLACGLAALLVWRRRR